MCKSPEVPCNELHESFPDGKHLNASVVKWILRDYPELWAQWQAKVLAPDALDKLGSGGVRRYHSPTYLRCVIRQYEHLAQGGDNVDPDLEARCVAVASTYPGFAEKRRRDLDDPWWRALDAPLDYTDSIASYYDPERLRRRIAGYREDDDPFTAAGIEVRQFEAFLRRCEMGRAGWAEFN